MERFDDAVGAQRRERRWLDDHSISRHQRRSELPHRDRDWKIPRCDQAHNAQWLAQRVTENILALGRNLIAELPRAFSTEVAKNIHGALHLALGFRQGFSFLSRHFLGDFS